MGNFLLIIITILLAGIIGLLAYLITTLKNQKKEEKKTDVAQELSLPTVTTAVEPLCVKFDSPLADLSFEDSLSINILLTKIQEHAKKDIEKSFIKQFRNELGTIGSNSFTYFWEKDTLVVKFSKEAQKEIKADTLRLMRQKNGYYQPTLLYKNKIVENARIDNTTKLLSKATKISSFLVGVAHIVSGADNAKQLKQISKNINYLIRARKNDQLCRLEATYKHAKELLSLDRSKETEDKIFSLSKDLHEIRAIWRREIETKLSDIENPENLNWFVKFFRLKKINKDINTDILSCEEYLGLITYTLLIHIELFRAIDKVDVFLEKSLPDEIKQLQATRDLLKEKSNYLSEKYPEFSVDPIIDQFDNVLNNLQEFVPNQNINPNLLAINDDTNTNMARATLLDSIESIMQLLPPNYFDNKKTSIKRQRKSAADVAKALPPNYFDNKKTSVKKQRISAADVAKALPPNLDNNKTSVSEQKKSTVITPMPNLGSVNGDITYRAADSHDIPQIQQLLRQNQLPYTDLITSKIFLTVAVANGAVIGCIGLEKKGTHGLLRFFAIDERFRNRGIGYALLNRILETALNEKIEKLHLLTTTAESYFRQNGFKKSDRATAPQAIKETEEFSTICPSSVVYMTLDIGF